LGNGRPAPYGAHDRSIQAIIELYEISWLAMGREHEGESRRGIRRQGQLQKGGEGGGTAAVKEIRFEATAERKRAQWKGRVCKEQQEVVR
jgi:hypothetical protein